MNVRAHALKAVENKSPQTNNIRAHLVDTSEDSQRHRLLHQRIGGRSRYELGRAGQAPSAGAPAAAAAPVGRTHLAP